MLEATFECACCGEVNETTVDPSQGPRQRYIEDCQVCCRANVLVVRVSEDGADIEAIAEGA